MVVLELSKEDAEKYSYALSDILCIVRGMELANPDLRGQMWGVEDARNLNIKLKSAINKASE